MTPPVQHTVNVAVASAPFALWVANADKIVAVAVGVMAFLYYLLYFTKEFVAWKKSWHKVETITTTHTVTKDTVMAPAAPEPPKV
jgi:hypothetical protein